MLEDIAMTAPCTDADPADVLDLLVVLVSDLERKRWPLCRFARSCRRYAQDHGR
jgi:hypothetical protein